MPDMGYNHIPVRKFFSKGNNTFDITVSAAGISLSISTVYYNTVGPILFHI